MLLVIVYKKCNLLNSILDEHKIVLIIEYHPNKTLFRTHYHRHLSPITNYIYHPSPTTFTIHHQQSLPPITTHRPLLFLLLYTTIHHPYTPSIYTTIHYPCTPPYITHIYHHTPSHIIHINHYTYNPYTLPCITNIYHPSKSPYTYLTNKYRQITPNNHTK